MTTPKLPTNQEELKQCLADPIWRITSGCLYKILIKGDGENDEGLVMNFIPNAPQMELMSNLHFRNIILKARQLGFTTFIAIYFLDCVLFRANVRAAIVAQDLVTAQSLFRDKVKFAYENLPPSIKASFPLERDSQSELLFSHNNSAIRVATSARSGTLQYLHVSEFGKICAKYPERAKEVITGSIPAVTGNGVVLIESTAEGQEGPFYDMCDRAENLKLQGKKLTKKDYRFNFFPWWIEPKYATDPTDVIITPKDDEYFDKIEADAHCILSLRQRAWWCMTRDADFSGQEELMWQEYPSTSAEAFQQSTEGCYYTVQMTAARKQGRITTVAHRAGYPVNTFWDIGNGDGTAIWLHQRIGQNDNFIGFIEGWGEPYSYYVTEMQKTGYVWGQHFLPHDAKHERQGQVDNSSPVVMLIRLGLNKDHISVVDQIGDISHGIQMTRDKFSTAWFDETHCAAGIIHLDRYRKRWNAQTGRFTDTAVKDVHTEAADAFRQYGQGYSGDPLAKKKRPPMRTRRQKDSTVGY